MDIREQYELLEHSDRTGSFSERLKACSVYPLNAGSVGILQMNITRRCNLCCRHCHVEGAPGRNEEMSREVMEACLHAATHPGVTTLDITGGAPEMHPHLEWFLREAAKLRKQLLVRSNAVILLDDPYRRFINVFAETGAEVIVSLPNLHRERTDRMRGEGVFDQVIDALRALNAAGFGRPGTGRILDLVHNPAGAFLPGSQSAMETEYRTRLGRDYGIEFNRLYCLTNCPAGRYLDFLKRSGNLSEYMDLLKQAFNPKAVGNVMCRNLVSVGWDGRLYDCDFNQILELPLSAGVPDRITAFDYEKLAHRSIEVRAHCFSCTAGAGSSCQGTLDE